MTLITFSENIISLLFAKSDIRLIYWQKNEDKLSWRFSLLTKKKIKLLVHVV